MRWKTRSMILIALACCASLAHAGPEVVFGPQTYERTTGAGNVYSDRFDLPSAGGFVLILHNGDGESSRVTSGAVEINGDPVVHGSDLNETVPGLRVPVELQAGVNEIVVELEGEPGSFVTLAIVAPGETPVFVHGRLVLPWGRHDADRALALAFKNGSHRAPRAFRAVFFRPDGSVAGASERIVLPPRGSRIFAVDDLLPQGGWTAGSVEVFYAGPGVARLFGSARQIALPLGELEIEPLESAGLRVQRNRPMPSTGDRLRNR